MSHDYSIMVFFNPEQLVPQDRNNPSRRKTLINEGVQTLKSAFPNVIFGSPLVSSLAVPVRVSEEVLPDLVEFLSKTRLGRFQFDAMALQAARGSTVP